MRYPGDILRGPSSQGTDYHSRPLSITTLRAKARHPSTRACGYTDVSVKPFRKTIQSSSFRSDRLSRKPADAPAARDRRAAQNAARDEGTITLLVGLPVD